MSHAVIIVVVKGEEEIEEKVSEQMAPFDENGEWFKNGSRWDWWTIGGRWDGFFIGRNILKRNEINHLEMLADSYYSYVKNYNRAMEDKNVRPDMRSFLYGINEDESLNDYLTRKIGAATLSEAEKKHPNFFPHTRSFLNNQHWHESGRMGWFGSDISSECEIEGKKKPKKCLTKVNEKARIVTWNEEADIWKDKFFDRFIKPLSHDDVLVAVDYHV